MPIKGIVFDYGGVIALPQNREECYSVCEKYGFTEAQACAGFERYRYLWDGGRITGQDMYGRIMDDLHLPHTPAILDELEDADSRSWAHPNPGTLAWARSLKAQGYKIGILTNMSIQFEAKYFHRVVPEFRALADAEVVSADVLLYKPCKEIYDCLAGRIGLAPAELVFFDDLPRNIDGAIAAGWYAFLFTTPEQAAADLARLTQGVRPC